MSIQFRINNGILIFYVGNKARITKRVSVDPSSDPSIGFDVQNIVRDISNGVDGMSTVGFFIGLAEDGAYILLSYVDRETSIKIKDQLQILKKKHTFNSFRIEIVEEAKNGSLKMDKPAKVSPSGTHRPYQTVINMNDSFMEKPSLCCLVK